MGLRRLAVLGSLALAACVGTVGETSGDDAGLVDAGVDAGSDDAGVVDAGQLDAGAPDAGTTDAGPPDAGGVDAGTPDAGGAPCASARFCDDFETYDAGARPSGPWTVSVSGGDARIDDTKAFSGGQSVRLTTDGQAAYRRAFISLTGAPVFPIPGNVMFGRLMMWLTAPPTQTTHWTNIQGEGPVPNQSYRSEVRYGGQVSQHLMANYDTSGVASDCWQHSTTVIPSGRWACFEWRYDAPNDTMNLWVDGVAIDALTVVGQGSGCISHDTGDHWYFPTFDTLRLGWEHYQTSDPIELWLDAVAVDTQRIGCP